MLKQLVSLAVAASSAACSVVGIRSGTEEPHFDVVGHVGGVEIRRYGERIAAETDVTGTAEDTRNAGFRRLAGYIFGANTTRSSIAMTAPVAQSSQTIAMTAPVAQTSTAPGVWRIQFYMPGQYTLETLPKPNDPNVRLVVVPAVTYAVLVFSGARDGETITKRERDLLADLTGSPWHATGEPVAWFYDPPWTLPPLRRNEVAVPVTREP